MFLLETKKILKLLMLLKNFQINQAAKPKNMGR